ncbi:SIR2 family protein [Rhizobium leguminosarum]|uniref:SIR2 family NAD-dependent protein deacylase n=1 Tax=Rhizobium leguminosarum TaxID=384 RepID=UPI00102F68FB|nr:SIR2 family protein [Rhizobium leguminosarum]TBF64265.1 SIR2 family protein [Rhizobium leguminosarum]TBG49664.1 SIR2 family protein [Rhizobium leguminosarum]
MITHDVVRQISYIQQALSQNRKHIGFFIGAGCPLSVRVNHREENGKPISDALIPDVAGLTGIIGTRLKSSDSEKPTAWDKVINLVQEDGGNHENIEHILTQIRLLASVAGKGSIRNLSSSELSELDEDICSVISEVVDKELPDLKTAYHNLAIWSRSIRREQPVHIFTTNYDLLLEQALEESSAPYFDGFIGTRRAFFDLGAVENEGDLPPRWSRLWKIHGSLNWKIDKANNVVRSDQSNEGQKHLIYPSHLKYDQSRKMPYLAMLDRLKEFLLRPSSILFMSGYSFGDEHINDVICRTLASNPTAHVFALLFGKLGDDKYSQARTCGLGTPNLSVLAFDNAIIGRISGEWKCSDVPFSLPEGIIVLHEEEETCELKLGDFTQFGNLLRNLTSTGDDSNG